MGIKIALQRVAAVRTRFAFWVLVMLVSFTVFAQTPRSAVAELQALSRSGADRTCVERKRIVFDGLRLIMARDIPAYQDPADFERRLGSDMELSEAQELIRACASPDRPLLTESGYRACVQREFGDSAPASAEAVLALLKLASCTR